MPSSRIANTTYILIGVASVALLAFALLRPTRPDDALEAPQLPPQELLETAMTDAMDYSLPFSRILAQRRIDAARRIAEARPELRPRALEVIDSLKARLERKAVISR